MNGNRWVVLSDPGPDPFSEMAELTEIDILKTLARGYFNDGMCFREERRQAPRERKIWRVEDKNLVCVYRGKKEYFLENV